MNVQNPRSAVKSVVAILCAACFLTMTLGAVSSTFAAEDWPVWPKKGAEPGVETAPAPPPQPVGAAKEGSETGQTAKKKMSAGMIGGIAAGTVALVAIAVAAGGGGGGSTSAPACGQ